MMVPPACRVHYRARDKVLMMSAIDAIDPNHQHDDVGALVVIRDGEPLLYSMKGSEAEVLLAI